MTNAEILKAPAELLGPIDKQKKYVLGMALSLMAWGPGKLSIDHGIRLLFGLPGSLDRANMAVRN